VLILSPEKRHELRDALAGKPFDPEAAVDALSSNPAVQAIVALATVEERQAAILKLAQSCRAELLLQPLKDLGIQNVDGWAKDLDNAIGNASAFQDYYIEGYYALRFAKCGLPVTLKPTGKQGPDIRLEIDGAEIYVEVSRFRENEVLEWEIGLGKCADSESNDFDLLPEMPDKGLKVLEKIRGESKQLIEGKPGIIMLHSNNVVIDELEFQRAIEYKATDLARVSAVIFGDSWRRVGATDHPVCWGFANPSAAAQIPASALQVVIGCLDANFALV
jgi:hypothetical protein